VNWWKVILATMVIFGAGVITGALVVEFALNDNSARHQRTAFGSRFMESGSPGGMRFEFLRRTQGALELTADQRERIDKILKQSQERTRKLMEPVTPQLHQEIQRAKTEFREVLTPAQQARFDELLKQPPRFHRPRPESSLTNLTVTNSI
jgi:Spy/CpxP family protein refolding chaperone